MNFELQSSNSENSDHMVKREGKKRDPIKTGMSTGARIALAFVCKAGSSRIGNSMHNGGNRILRRSVWTEYNAWLARVVSPLPEAPEAWI